MGGFELTPDKLRDHRYVLKAARFMIKSLLKLQETQDLASEEKFTEDLPIPEFNNEYQVFQMVENQVHKGNIKHSENMNKIRNGDKKSETVPKGRYYNPNHLF